MIVVILLLKEAIRQYDRGTVAVGDELLRIAYKFRIETTKDNHHPPEKPKEGP